MRKNKNLTTSSLRFISLLIGVPSISACQHIDLAQVTYEMLRAEDCRRNQLDDFCARTYASEYYDYVRMREEFMQNENQGSRLAQPMVTENQLTLQKILDNR